MKKYTKFGLWLSGLFMIFFNLRSTIRRALENLDHLDHLDHLGHLDRNVLRLYQKIEDDLLLKKARRSETVQNHLAKLGKSSPIDPIELSYSFDHASRSLHPQIYRNSSTRDILVFTVALGDDFRKIVQPCLDNQRFYCQSKGYDYAILDLKPSVIHRKPSWYKIPLAYKLLQLGYKDIFYIDADALITNSNTSLQPFFDKLTEDKKVISVAEDEDGINMGVFFMKNVPDAIRLLDLIWSFNMGGEHLQYWEQGAFKTLLNDYAQVRKLLFTPPSAKAFNSFPKEREAIHKTIQENNWTSGDFICHFSGLEGPMRDQLIRHYVVECLVKSSP